MIFRLAVALSVLLATTIVVHADARSVALRAADGTPLAGALYEPFNRPAPGVVLIHMLTRSKADWGATAERLRQAGFVVLAVDLRGHGASSGTTLGSGDLGVLIQDAQAAVAYLRSRPGVAPGRVGIAGASLGASLAALVASTDLSIRSLALLSPSLDYRGVKCEAALRKYGDRPALLVAASGDPYAMRSVKQLAAKAVNREVLITDALGHGTVLLARQPILMDQLVDWFRRTLL
jgi:alpha-beta hydrolase superfamily lysophospholipase